MAAAMVAAASVCTAAGVTLDVPFVPQGEDLCGGAAAAMVLRYWGEHGVHAEAFAPLVDRSAGGIRTAALASDLRGRGWVVVDGPGTIESLRRELDRGRPVIALIEVRPSRYHYVVVIGATDEAVVLHDPARGPSRTMRTPSFESAWAKSDHWMLVLLPRAGSDPAVSTPRMQKSGSDPGVAAGGQCAVDAGVQFAANGDYAAARRTLERATEACAGQGAPWRELAGVDALEAHWGSAAQHARRAVDIDPGDAHAWRILATAEYLEHHDRAALDAWNRIGEPTVDLVDVKGLRETRYAVVADAMGVAPGRTLTWDSLRLAERRARDVPSIATARVSFHPLENGRAQIDAAIVERDRAPAAYPSWIGIGLNAATNRELAVSFANPSGGGDLVSVTWRWWTHRPLVSASYAAPAPRALGGGTWSVEATRETQTFSPGLFAETRTRGAFGLSRWMTARARLGGAAGLDSWSDLARTPFLSGDVEFWPVLDRVSVRVRATRWFGGGGAHVMPASLRVTSDQTGAAERGFSAVSLIVRRQPAAPAIGFAWLAHAGYDLASVGAPPSVWPGADTGHARDVLLRAHPLLDDGVIRTPLGGSGREGVIARRLAFGSVEVQKWRTVGKWPVKFAPAAFLDGARGFDSFGGVSSPFEVDAGAGVRVSLLGLGVLRVDVAHGLRDGSNAVSVGFVR